MADELMEMAVTVIEQAGHETPADEALRRAFHGRRPLQEGARWEVSQAVFAYYRWLGWLDTAQPVAARIKRARELAWRYRQEPGSFSDEELLERAVPGWTQDEVSVSPAWVRTLQREPVLWLRARRRDLARIRQRLADCRPAGEGRLAEALEYPGDEDIFRTEEFHRGEIEIQDLGSQLVGLICNPQPGGKWWDACAGEGGKTLHLSELMSNQGLIWATDRAQWRLDLLRRRAGRAGMFNYRQRIWTGGAELPTKTLFDGVLLDAPCSGVGTWQRNPHARWTTTPVDVNELRERQKSLLGHASAGVAAGGKLIYAVCTLTRSETEEVANWFEAEFKQFQPTPISNPMGKSPKAAQEGRLWLWPQETGGNGMFVASWTRRPVNSSG